MATRDQRFDVCNWYLRRHNSAAHGRKLTNYSPIDYQSISHLISQATPDVSPGILSHPWNTPWMRLYPERLCPIRAVLHRRSRHSTPMLYRQWTYIIKC